MSRAVRNYQNVTHSGTFRFTGGVTELSPSAEPNILAVYEGALFLSASLLGNTVWVPMARSGMTKVHDQVVPVYNWSIPNPFNSTDVLVQVYDTEGYKYIPSIKVTPTEILIEHTSEQAGRAMIISTGNLLTGFPDVILDSEKGTAGGVATLDTNAKVPLHQLYLATVAQQGLVQLNDTLVSSSVTQALTANQGRILKELIDNINTLLTTDDTALDELQEIVDFIKLNRADLDALNVDSISGLTAALATKVDKVAGKQLSTEDYTTAEKNKLAGVQPGAQVNVGTNLSYTQSTRELASSTGQSVTLPLVTPALPGLMSEEDKTKLNGIAAGAQANVATNLSVTTAASTTTVVSSTGDNAVLPAATTSAAGVMTAADKTSLNTIASGLSSGQAFDKYSVVNTNTSGAINLNTAQVWQLTDPGSARTVSISNPPPSGRSMSVVIKVIGNRATTWPAGIQWADGLAPVLAANWTFVILTYINGTIHGSVGPSA